MSVQNFNLKDFHYELPQEKIALYPLEDRAAAKLLVYRHGQVSHRHFFDLPEELPENSLLVFNNTRVVQARLLFRRTTGALIELLCLKPLSPYSDITPAMMVKGHCIWECMAGNQKRWKVGETLSAEFQDGILHATLIKKIGREAEVDFQWQPGVLNFSEVLSKAGSIPLPPYLNRTAGKTDKRDYQTIYALKDGAIAAPTAGLHFSSKLLETLAEKKVAMEWLTLHVGAGTFQPVSAQDIRDHHMHQEQLEFGYDFIKRLCTSEKKVIAVGTTSMRALESLYWFGVQLLKGSAPESFFIHKSDPYASGKIFPPKDVLNAILEWMEKKNLKELVGQTEIFIFHGYKFQLCQGLITNFHLPQSTLLMLISAFIGDDWKKIYQIALEKNYRFLSYGDGMLLLPFTQ